MGDCAALPLGDREALALARSHSVFPPIPSQGKILNVLRGDCEALPTGDCAALPTGDRKALHTGDCAALPTGDCEALPVGDRITLPMGDCAALPTGDREGLATWRLSVGETGNQFPVSKLKSVEN
ncbi:hypothetical protein ASL19_07360 [Cylindrospermopsis sp. CR12]|nr:hypothetical protein ASL19_07360 [Cylindrospermopsis sp. CR12]